MKLTKGKQDRYGCPSQSARTARIEIPHGGSHGVSYTGRSPQGPRGLKFLLERVPADLKRRSPQGPRGLKLVFASLEPGNLWSQSARTARIEIRSRLYYYKARKKSQSARTARIEIAGPLGQSPGEAGSRSARTARIEICGTMRPACPARSRSARTARIEIGRDRVVEQLGEVAVRKDRED